MGSIGQNIVTSPANQRSQQTKRVTIQDLQYFIAKADSKVKKLRMSIGDYDPSDVEHHKVVNTIFSLVKRLLRLTGPELTKDFLMKYQNTATQKPLQDRRRNEYDDSGSSDKDYAKNDGLSDDYFPAAASSRS